MSNIMQAEHAEQELPLQCPTEPETQDGSTKAIRKKVVLSIIGCISGLALIAVGVYAGMGVLQKDISSPISVRQLMESDEFADSLTDNVMAVESRHPATRAKVRTDVALNVKKASGSFGPEDDRLLNSLKLSPKEKDAALHSMRLISDPRALNMNNAVIGAVHKAVAEHKDHDFLVSQIKENLMRHAEDIKGVHDELYQGEHSFATVADIDPEKFDIVKEFDEWKVAHAGKHLHLPEDAAEERRLDLHEVGISSQLAIFVDVVNRKFSTTIELPGSRRLAEYTCPNNQVCFSVFTCLMENAQAFQALLAANCFKDGVGGTISDLFAKITSMFHGGGVR